MSRIGKLPISIPAGVTVNVEGRVVKVKGPLGQLEQKIDSGVINVKAEDGRIVVSRAAENKPARSKHGLYRALIANMVTGVTQGFSRTLIVNGVGYKCAVNGNKLTMNIGYSHPVDIIAPNDIKITCVNPLEIKVEGISKEKVGHTAAKIRAAKPVEPYHSYGVRYSDEVVIKKEGKTAGK